MTGDCGAVVPRPAQTKVWFEHDCVTHRALSMEATIVLASPVRALTASIMVVHVRILLIYFDKWHCMELSYLQICSLFTHVFIYKIL